MVCSDKGGKTAGNAREASGLPLSLPSRRAAAVTTAPGSGVAVLDYDNDGWLDIYLYLLNASTVAAIKAPNRHSVRCSSTTITTVPSPPTKRVAALLWPFNFNSWMVDNQARSRSAVSFRLPGNPVFSR